MIKVVGVISRPNLHLNIKEDLVSEKLNVVECTHLPKNPYRNTIYRLTPNNPDPDYYRERVDRNIGWITEEEQEILKNTVVGIAGCGGMGGLLAERMVRLGIGEIRIADPEVFDTSNINRQFGARRDTVGKSKAFVTAQMVRQISNDTTLMVYPQGIAGESVGHFLGGCDVILDEIEFWVIGARILLHQEARRQKIAIFNCNTVGFGSRLFLFTHSSAQIEEMVGYSLQEAISIEETMRSGRATEKQKRGLLENLLFGLVPEFPQYQIGSGNHAVYDRLLENGKASIIATNPPLATGLVADRMLLYLLRNSFVARNIAPTPKAPDYIYIDAGKIEARIVHKKKIHP